MIHPPLGPIDDHATLAPGSRVTPPRPRVSVIIPVFNGEEYLAEAITSVLDQDFADLECIVVDDGSTDSTPTIIHGFDDPRVRCIRTENRGLPSARNVGIAEAKGELIALLDGDDVWLPGKLTAQIARLDAEPELGFVTCWYTITDRHLQPVTDIRLSGSNKDVRRWLLLEGNGLGFGSTAVIPARVLADVGPFEPVLTTSEDVDLAARIAASYPVIAEPVIYTLYRTHDRQIHLDLELLERNCTLVLERRLADRPTDLRRGTANLHTRLTAYHLRARNRRWRKHLAITLRARPDRLILLPLEALVRRARRRIAGRDRLRSLIPARRP